MAREDRAKREERRFRRPERHIPSPPCVRCGTTGGKTPPGSRNAVRASGRKLGIDGFLCNACYEKLFRIRHGHQPSPRPVRPVRRHRDRLDGLDDDV
jgi:hypothetical protein